MNFGILNWERFTALMAGVLMALAGVPGVVRGQPAPLDPSSPAAPQPLVTAVESVGMVVGDMDRALRFYTAVLPFEKVSDVEIAGDEYEHLTGVFGMRARVVRVRLGGEFLDLIDYLAPEGRAIPPESRSNDRTFQHIAIVVSDMDRAYAHLRRHNVQHASSGPQTLPAWNKNAGGIRAFYFKDPENHVLEVISFPPGKGEPRWQAQPDRLFLGIDHTAIVVADTDTSLRYYRDTVGLHVAGASENYGTEQEHLNNIFGARLRITGLRGMRGPGVELLEYLAPRNGHAMPSDALANDCWSWHVRFAAPDTAAVFDHLRADPATLVSSDAVSVGAELGFVRGLVARDPDGHLDWFTEQREEPSVTRSTP